MGSRVWLPGASIGTLPATLLSLRVPTGSSLSSFTGSSQESLWAGLTARTSKPAAWAVGKVWSIRHSQERGPTPGCGAGCLWHLCWCLSLAVLTVSPSGMSVRGLVGGPRACSPQVAAFSAPGVRVGGRKVADSAQEAGQDEAEAVLPPPVLYANVSLSGSPCGTAGSCQCAGACCGSGAPGADRWAAPASRAGATLVPLSTGACRGAGWAGGSAPERETEQGRPGRLCHCRTCSFHELCSFLSLGLLVTSGFLGSCGADSSNSA